MQYSVGKCDYMIMKRVSLDCIWEKSFYWGSEEGDKILQRKWQYPKDD